MSRGTIRRLQPLDYLGEFAQAMPQSPVAKVLAELEQAGKTVSVLSIEDAVHALVLEEGIRNQAFLQYMEPRDARTAAAADAAAVQKLALAYGKVLSSDDQFSSIGNAETAARQYADSVRGNAKSFAARFLTSSSRFERMGISL